MIKIIGISGMARSGKDTIAKYLMEEIKETFPNLEVEHKSLAFFLKEEMKEFLREKFKVDVHSLDGDEKETLRPLLVAYGFAKRKETNGAYFTDLMDKEFGRDDKKVYIISDIRYADKDGDELFWLKKKNGKLIHIKRHEMKDGKKKYIKPPNEDEKRNDPKLNKESDFKIDWCGQDSDQNLKKLAKEYCEDFILQNIKFFS